VVALVAQVSSQPLHGLRDLVVGWREVSAGRCEGLRDLLFDGGIKGTERAGSLCGLAQDVAASEAGEIFSGIVKAELVRGAVGAEQFQLGVAKLRIHLQNGRPLFRGLG
jgi:hypothetical protein